MSNKLLKVLVWRVISIFITLCVLTIVTGSVSSATGVTLFLHAFLTGCHYAFETLWDRFAKKEGIENV